MKFHEVSHHVRDVPFIDPANAEWVYNLILRERLETILELGIGHGTATCYLAAAVDELDAGFVTAVDLAGSETWFKPAPEEQLAKAGLSHRVEIVRMKSGYNWFLHDEIKRVTVDGVCVPRYDLCIIDGPKNWTIDGCAFFLVDKILKPGGWVIFDDYSWTYADAGQSRDSTDGVNHSSLSEVERTTPHVAEIFELLVRQHPDYSEFVLFPDSGWAAARKLRTSGAKDYTVAYHEVRPAGVLNAVARRARRLHRLMRDLNR